jgi:predicted AAA+ superfamily ATPase
MLPVLERLPDVDEMIKEKSYFVIHAPRRSGKTTLLKSLTDDINSKGEMRSLYCSLETREDITDFNEAIKRIVSEINISSRASRLPSLSSLAVPNDMSHAIDASIRVRRFLNDICFKLDKELTIFFDEADCLIDSSLITFLRQIRLGYNNRHDFGNVEISSFNGFSRDEGHKRICGES